MLICCIYNTSERRQEQAKSVARMGEGPEGSIAVGGSAGSFYMQFAQMSG